MSPRKLREIDDPVMQMLTQLHKVVYVSQVLFFSRTFVSLVEYSVVSIANLINYSHFWKMFSNLGVTFNDNCSGLKIQLGLFRLLCFSWVQLFYFDLFCQSQIAGDNSDTLTKEINKEKKWFLIFWFSFQLPPSLKFDSGKKIIDLFKRSLFGPGSTVVNLKNELKRVGAHRYEVNARRSWFVQGLVFMSSTKY